MEKKWNPPLKNFKDKRIADGEILLDLIEACQPGCVKQDVIRTKEKGYEMNDEVSLAIVYYVMFLLKGNMVLHCFSL